MKKLLLTTALLGAIGASPAWAGANSAITLWNAGNPGDAETATGTGSAAVATSNLDGITITLSKVSRGTGPNDLTEGNIDIANTTNAVQTLRIIAGADGYLGPSSAFLLTGTIGATLGGYDFSGSFFADQTNSLNGSGPLSVTGLDIGDFDSGALTGPHSFSFNGVGLDKLFGTYGLAESLTLKLQPGATVFVTGVSMDANAVPEPSTWAMLLGGFGLIGILGLRKRRVPRFAV